MDEIKSIHESHRKMRHINRLSIIYSVTMPSSSRLKKEVLNNHQQSIISNTHIISLILREKESPKLNPMNSLPNNLQKISALLFIKNIIISSSLNGPTKE
jgi:microcystin degradation protein MlrC